MIVSADTVVHTPRGNKFVGVLAAKGETVFCFTYSLGKITLGRVGFEEIGEHETMRVVLDNGTTLRCVPGTKLISRKGDVVDAVHPEALSVMPLYLSRTTNGYSIYRQVRDDRRDAPAPSDRKPWRSVARMVWEWRTGQRLHPGFCVRHLDNDRANCHPDNLRVEGKPQRRPRKNKLRRLIKAQRMKSPGNHKVVGTTSWELEPVCRIVPLDCTNIGLSEVFVGAHGS